VKIVEHLLIVLPGSRILIAQNIGSVARAACKEQQQIVFKIRQGFGGNF